jgi:hypothetical protein
MVFRLFTAYPTVHLTSIDNPVPEYPESSVVPCETIVGQVKKKKSH